MPFGPLSLLQADPEPLPKGKPVFLLSAFPMFPQVLPLNSEKIPFQSRQFPGCRVRNWQTDRNGASVSHY
jgi:hypothetical protein